MQSEFGLGVESNAGYITTAGLRCAGSMALNPGKFLGRAAGVEGVTQRAVSCAPTRFRWATECPVQRWRCTRVGLPPEADSLKDLLRKLGGTKRSVCRRYIRDRAGLDRRPISCCSKTGRRCLQKSTPAPATPVQECYSLEGFVYISALNEHALTAAKRPL